MLRRWVRDAGARRTAVSRTPFVDLPRFRVIGEVVYLSRPQGFGLRFVDLPVGEKLLLVRGLRRQGLADPYGHSRPSHMS